MPAVVKPVAAYLPARKHNDLIYVSGQLPMHDGKLLMSGVMTNARPLEEAQKAMARCFLNALAAAAECGQIIGVLRLAAFVASDPDFTSQHLVANGASELAGQLFGDAGRHVRAAVGVSSLPLGATVELEVVFGASA